MCVEIAHVMVGNTLMPCVCGVRWLWFCRIYCFSSMFGFHKTWSFCNIRLLCCHACDKLVNFFDSGHHVLSMFFF